MSKRKDKKERKMPRKRGLKSAKSQTDSSVTVSNWQQSANVSSNKTVQIDCKGRAHICGIEPACHIFQDKTEFCVCPHDGSFPTEDLKCPNRSIVSEELQPTYPIIPPTEIEKRIYRVSIEVIGVSIAVFVLVCLLGILYGVKRRSYSIKKSQRSALYATPINLKKGLLLTHKYTPNPQYFTCASPEIPIIERESLVFLHDIGEGCFGKVYKGEWRNGSTKEIVAVKVLKDGATREAEEDFMREVDIMSTFGHANILSLKGMVLRDAANNPWMVFEYMPYGDLAEVLRANYPQYKSESKPGLQPLTKESLHSISIQIAAGMTYLSAQRFVHRDLACRNCLVGSDLVVKIADFGMSRDVYTCDYYKIGGSRLLPLRWMSPESIMYGRFTLETDVWSYGIVLYEVFSYGKQPYYGHSNEEVVKLILDGVMLTPPDGCPDIVCEIMRDCWKIEPRERIKFPDILDRLKQAQGKLPQQGTLPRPPQGPVTVRTPNNVDPDGYLLPAPAPPREYLQALPTLAV